MSNRLSNKEIVEACAKRYFKGFDLRMGKELFFHIPTHTFWVKVIEDKAKELWENNTPHNPRRTRLNVKVLCDSSYGDFYPVTEGPRKGLVIYELFFIQDSISGDEGVLRLFGSLDMSKSFQDRMAISKGMKRMNREISRNFIVTKKVTT